MARLRLVVTLAALLWTVDAAAQPALFTGLVTGHLGAASGGDVRGSGLTPGAAIGVLDGRGVGAELDLGHTRRFDDERFAESGITTLMVSALWMRPHPTIRPFGGAGAGLLRVRASIADGVPVANRTDWGFTAGGGVAYMFNEAFGVRGEVRYFRYFQRHADVPLRDNGFFDFWRTSVGVTYAWPIS